MSNSNSDEILENFKLKAEYIIRNDSFNDLQQETLLELSNLIYSSLKDISSK